MALFKAIKEINYEKPLIATLLDIEKAFTLVGKIQKIDRETYKVHGIARYGFQKVKIEVQVETVDDKTKVIFRGKGGDVGGVGAKGAIKNLIDTMHNLDNPDYVPSKTSGLSPKLIILSIIEIILFFIIVIGSNTGDIESSVITVLAIIWFALFAYILIIELKRKIAKAK